MSLQKVWTWKLVKITHMYNLKAWTWKLVKRTYVNNPKSNFLERALQQ